MDGYSLVLPYINMIYFSYFDKRTPKHLQKKQYMLSFRKDAHCRFLIQRCACASAFVHNQRMLCCGCNFLWSFDRFYSSNGGSISSYNLPLVVSADGLRCWLGRCLKRHVMMLLRLQLNGGICMRSLIINSWVCTIQLCSLLKRGGQVHFLFLGMEVLEKLSCGRQLLPYEISRRRVLWSCGFKAHWIGWFECQSRISGPFCQPPTWTKLFI